VITSFGHANGVPSRVDKVFDVRTLTHETSNPEFDRKIDEITDYARQNPHQHIAIGCKLGKHRAPKIAAIVSRRLNRSVMHRDS
jgi:RNase adaptor protein for sRNA GlmZ degradation